jgi:MoxR-like ATPase
MSGDSELGFRELLRRSIVDGILIDKPVILKGQYKRAYDLLRDSIDAGVTPCLVGPPGVGKSLLARKIAVDSGRGFYEVFFDENMTPSRLVGAFDPALVVRRGRTVESFEPGPRPTRPAIISPLLRRRIPWRPLGPTGSPGFSWTGSDAG